MNSTAALSYSFDYLVETVSEIISDITGNVLEEKQYSMVENRLSKRMLDLDLGRPEDYLDHLLKNFDQETEILISLLTTHHTFFFREAVQFDYLIENFENIVKNVRKRGDDKIRVWSAACSKGQEAYSLSMILSELIEKKDIDISYEIFGTDIDRQSVSIANNAVYHKNEIKDITPELRKKYVLMGDDSAKYYFTLTDEIIAPCKFQTFNLLEWSKYQNMPLFDCIFCRNVLIYFKDEQIKKISEQLIKHLYKDGVFITGVTEPISKYNLNIYPVGPSTYSQQMPVVARTPIITNKDELKINVMIIDDSPVIRKVLANILSQDKRFNIVASTDDATEVENVLRENPPDVITLDIFMPKMDGLAMLKKIISKHNIPTVFITSYNLQNGNIIFDALEHGAVDYIEKPHNDTMTKCSVEIINKLTIASKIDLTKGVKRKIAIQNTSQKFNQDCTLLIGASTGGINAIQEIIQDLPDEIPPTLIVQHIPPVFSQALAQRINRLCKFTVKEAVNGEKIQKNTVYIAPGGKQMALMGKAHKRYIQINDDPPVGRFKPSVDYLFHSAAKLNDSTMIATILTGMGRDGAQGICALKRNGVRTIAQDEGTSVVFGMPKAAIDDGGIDQVLPLDKIASSIVKLSHKLK